MEAKVRACILRDAPSALLRMRVGNCARLKMSNSQAPSPLFLATRGRRSSSSFPPAIAEGDGAPVGATSWWSPVTATSLWREARAGRRSIGGDFCLRAALPGTRASGCDPRLWFALSQSSESSSQTGHSARRAGSRSLPGACLRGTPAGAASATGFRPLASGGRRSCRRQIPPDGPALTNAS